MSLKKIDSAKATLQQQRASDGAAAAAEYRAAIAAEQMKTARLKALRLARDAAAKVEAAVAPSRLAPLPTTCRFSSYHCNSGLGGVKPKRKQVLFPPTGTPKLLYV